MMLFDKIFFIIFLVFLSCKEGKITIENKNTAQSKINNSEKFIFDKKSSFDQVGYPGESFEISSKKIDNLPPNTTKKIDEAEDVDLFFRMGKNLPRPGNTCYASAAIQLHREWLYKMFKKIDKINCDISNLDERTNLLRQIVYDLYEGKDINIDEYGKMINSTISQSEIGIVNINEYFDLNEFFVLLMSDNNLQKIFKKSNLKIPIYMKLKSELQCLSCNATISSYEYALSISINIDFLVDNFGVCDIIKKNNNSIQEVEGSRCSSCNKTCNAIQKNVYYCNIDQEYLQIFLQGRLKSNIPFVYIDTPLNNPLQDIILLIENSDSKIVFELIGIAVFKHSYRHYISYVKRGNEWYKYDDLREIPEKIINFDTNPDFKLGVNYLYRKKKIIN